MHVSVTVRVSVCMVGVSLGDRIRDSVVVTSDVQIQTIGPVSK